ncbi:MAG: hypothetical protein V4582_23870 [Pseudomonadota bacterium]
MLRTALLGFSVLLTLGGVVGLMFGCPLWAPAVWGIALLACVLLERWRYRKPDTSAGGNWQTTGEKFIDPESGQAMEVLYDPGTGERRYVAEAKPPS